MGFGVGGGSKTGHLAVEGGVLYFVHDEGSWEVLKDLVEEGLEVGEGFGVAWDGTRFGPQQTIRDKVLTESNLLVHGDREDDYGTPQESLSGIAEEWSMELGVKVTPVQVARMMLRLKLRRSMQNPKHLDSWVDMAGYAAIGAELAQGVIGVEDIVSDVIAGDKITAGLVDLDDAYVLNGKLVKRGEAM